MSKKITKTTKVLDKILEQTSKNLANAEVEAFPFFTAIFIAAFDGQLYLLRLDIMVALMHSRSGGGGGSSGGRGGASREATGASQERTTEFSRWRERQYFGPRRWLESALRDTSWDKEGGEFLRF